MKKIFLLLVFLLCASAARAQSTTVSGTITDSGSQVWFAGSIQFRFRPSDSNPTAQYFWNGAPFDKSTTIPANPLALDGSGSFSGQSIPSNTAISPAGSTWTTTVCPAATVPNCYTKNLTITGATQDISSQVIPPPVVVNLTVPLLGARAYTDAEIQGAVPGVSYLNVTDNKLHLCIQNGFPPCTWSVQGTGSVSSVSSGNFSPLFNVTVTNPTTTPAFSYTAQNAAAGTIFGNPSGSPAPPSFNAPSAFSNIVNSVTATSPLASSGGNSPNLTCLSCVVGVTGTANQITSSGGTAPTLSIPATFIAPGSIQATTSITGTSITDSGLTANRCVQTSTGGLLTVSSNTCVTGNGGVLAAPTTCNLGAPINSITSGVTTTIIACATTAPSSGCPCRAYVSWSIAALGTSSTEQVEGQVSDGTTAFAGTSAILNNQVTTGDPGINRSDFSANTYANNASVTFTLSAVSDHTWSVVTATNFLSAPTQVRVTYFTSN